MSEKTSKMSDCKKILAFFAICIYGLSIIFASSFAPASAVPPSQPDLFDLVDWTLGNVTEMQSKMEKFDVVAVTDEYFAEPGGFNTLSVFVDVTCNGEGVADLDDENFEAVALRFPLGSYMPRIEDVEKFPVTPGSYWIHMKPKLGDTWREGLYIWDLLVTDGNRTGSTIFTVTVLEGNQVSWMNDVIDKLSDIEEKLNSQPKLFNKTYTLNDPFDEDSWYEIWVNSTENYVVKAVYANVWYGAEDLHISFSDQSFRLYMPGLEYPFADQMIFLKSESWNEYVDRPFGWEAELLNRLSLEHYPVCPASSTFAIRFSPYTYGPPDDYDDVIHLNILVESAQNATVKIGFTEVFP